MYSQYQYTMSYKSTYSTFLFFLKKKICYSLCVKARPSDPLVYVWILWCHFFFALFSLSFWKFLVLLAFFVNKIKALFKRGRIYIKNKYKKVRTFNLFFASRGVRKVTTGITGLWRRSVQSDAAFWFFDVGSSYPVPASEHKGEFVHLPTGNVSWV